MSDQQDREVQARRLVAQLDWQGPSLRGPVFLRCSCGGAWTSVTVFVRSFGYLSREPCPGCNRHGGIVAVRDDRATRLGSL